MAPLPPDRCLNPVARQSASTHRPSIQPNRPGWRRWLALAVGITLGGVLLPPASAWGQVVGPEAREEFLADPERTSPRDPLLPVLPVERPLSPLERQALAVELNRLAQAGEALYRQGNRDQAFTLWMREVRLRRILGLEAELARIRTLGERVWQDSRTPEAQLLTLRLGAIEQALLAQPSPALPQIVALAEAYETLRAVDQALALYDRLAERALQEGQRSRQLDLLDRQARLLAAWFRFQPAAETYRRLAALATQQNLSSSRIEGYLRRAIANFEQVEAWEAAIALQQQLLQRLEGNPRSLEAASLRLALARNYRAWNRLDLAVPQYQAAYRQALSQNQTVEAEAVVAELAELYGRANRWPEVRYLYEQQILVNRLSFNAYGIMTTFARLGEWHEARGDIAGAIAAYQEGLILAHHLGHRQGDFAWRLQRLRIQTGQVTPSPTPSHQGSTLPRLPQPPPAWQGN